MQRQADALNAGGGESDHYPKLHAHALALYTHGGMAPCILTATLAPGESSTMFPCRLSSLHCAYRYLVVGRMLCVGCVCKVGNVYSSVLDSAGVGVAKRHAESVKCTRRLGKTSRRRACGRDQPTDDVVGLRKSVLAHQRGDAQSCRKDCFNYEYIVILYI